MDDISEEDEATLLAMANASAKRINAEREAGLISIQKSIDSIDREMAILKETLALNKQNINTSREIMEILQQEVTLIQQQRALYEQTTSNMGALLVKYNNQIQRADLFLEKYNYLEYLN